MFLICGLGNPGQRYINTRHNIGFDLIDRLILKFNFSIIKKDTKKELYKGYIGSHNCILLKPLTYMNLSGVPVKEILKFYKIKKNKLYVIHDDIDLKISKVKIKIGGGNGGHNGLLSIDDEIGKHYNRIRIGIDHPGSKKLVANYVLKKFTNDEKKLIERKLINITDLFELALQDTNLFLTRLAEVKR
tara:strand:- start:5011 stop:5574 length:564 start_codon:yes stop_codon:yes gene_type:complete